MLADAKANAPRSGIAPAPAGDVLAGFEVEANQSYLDFEGPRAYRGFPVRLSLPLPEGACQPSEGVRVAGPGGEPLASFVHPFAHWPDGSVRLWEVWFPLDLPRGEKAALTLRRGGGAPSAFPDAGFRGPSGATLTATLADGTTLSARIDFAEADGTDAPPVWRSEHPFALGLPGEEKPRFRGEIVRRGWRWYAGMEWEVRLTNYDLGAEVVAVHGVELAFDLSAAAAPAEENARPPAYLVRQTAMTAWGHPRLTRRDAPIHVRAEGSVHAADAAELGEDEGRYPPYERGGYVLSLSPWLALLAGDAAWALVVPEAAERGPKAWRFEDRRAVVELHPADAPPLEWRQGMTLYQRMVLLRRPAAATPEEVESEAQAWLRPPLVRLEPDAYRRAGWRLGLPYDPARFPRTEFELRESFDFSWTPGTFDWGDQVAGTKGGGPVAPGSRGLARNLEYDFPAVAAKAHARTGSGHLLRLCRESAQHMMHTDFVAASDDPWKEGGIVHHSPGHTSGSAYPSHMWAEGLTLYYQLTGDPHALRVFRRVGDFYLKYIRERFAVVQGTAREVGWALIALAAIYDFTREERYLDGIRRVVDHNLARGRERFFPTDACFTIGVAIIGLDRTRVFHRDADTRRFIVELLDWMMAERRDGIGLFEYWRDPELGAIPYIQTHLPEALHLGYRLTGDERYLRAAYRNYQIHRAGGLLTVQGRFSPPECGYAAGNYISWIGCFGAFAEKGWLDALQFPEPGMK